MPYVCPSQPDHRQTKRSISYIGENLLDALRQLRSDDMHCQHFHGRKQLNSDFRHNFLVRCPDPDYRPIPRYKVSRRPNHNRRTRYAFALAKIRHCAGSNFCGNLVSRTYGCSFIQIIGNSQFAKLELPGCCLTGTTVILCCSERQ